MSRMIQFRALEPVIPWTLDHIARLRRQGRLNWIGHTDPLGYRSKEVWVDVDAASAWMIARGYNDLDALCRAAGIRLPQQSPSQE